MKGVKHWEELHMERLALGRSYALGRVMHWEEHALEEGRGYALGGVMQLEELRIGRSYTLGEVTDLHLGRATHLEKLRTYTWEELCTGRSYTLEGAHYKGRTRRSYALFFTRYLSQCTPSAYNSVHVQFSICSFHYGYSPSCTVHAPSVNSSPCKLRPYNSTRL